MKTIIFILSLCLTSSSFATSLSIQDVINEHQYFMEVEWDQQDQASLKAHEALFKAELAKFPAAELEKYLKENVNPDDFEALRKQKEQGASWNAAGTALMVAGGVTLTLFVAYTWFIHNQLECDGFYDCHGGE